MIITLLIFVLKSVIDTWYADTIYPCFREKPIIRQKGGQYRKGPIRYVSILLNPRKSVKNKSNFTRTSERLKSITQYRKALESTSTNERLESTAQCRKAVESTLDSSVKENDVSNEMESSSSAKFPQDSDLSDSHKGPTEVDEVMEEIRNTCPFCDKYFDNVKKVERHVRYVHRKPYQCDRCKRACYTSRALEEHKRTHRPDYFFECRICHIKYKSADGLKRHYIRIHSDYDSKFVCEHCGHRYKLKIDLTHHIKRTHTSQLQICRFCGKEVRDVKAHEWRHQKRNRKPRHECHLCRKRFHHRSRLDKHLMLHKKGFKCDECGKEYNGTRELNSHKRFKHGPANISTCALCEKTFTSISNYYQHVLTHAGIRPYTCDICFDDFTQRSSLLRHRKSHPGPLPPISLPHPQIAKLARNYLQEVRNELR